MRRLAGLETGADVAGDMEARLARLAPTEMEVDLSGLPESELEALRRKSQEPCDRHENGGCDCGRDKQKKE